MNTAFKALGALLTYPTPELQAAVAEIGTAIDAEARLPQRVKASLHALLTELAAGDVLELQERYVALFDRGRATSLNLFEHVHGDSRDRGPAMVDLMQVYAHAGFSLCSNELPDYLPVLLEFLSRRPVSEADEMLSDCAHIVRKLGDALRSRGSCYDAVPAAVLAMIGAAGLSAPATDKANGAIGMVDENALDEDWMDAPVIFGPEGAPDCKPVRPAPTVIKFMPRQN
jgi:nitrate reductase molybdenum cofactor assembly chaperone NarJ/NarW